MTNNVALKKGDTLKLADYCKQAPFKKQPLYPPFKKLKAMIGAVFVVVVHEDMFPSNGYLHSFAIDLAYDISSLPFVLDAAVKTGFVPADDSFARGSSKSDKTDLADAVDEWDIVDYYNPEMLATFKKEMKKGKRGSDPFCLFHGDRGKYVFP